MNLLSNISKGTGIWSEGRVLGRLAQRSDFDLERDVVGRVATLFVSVPEDLKAVYAPFMRVMVGLSLQAVARISRQGAPMSPASLGRCPRQPERLATRLGPPAVVVAGIAIVGLARQARCRLGVDGRNVIGVGEVGQVAQLRDAAFDVIGDAASPAGGRCRDGTLPFAGQILKGG